jgi:hypothetical protein
MLTPTIRRLIVCGARAENAGRSNVWNGSEAEVRSRALCVRLGDNFRTRLTYLRQARPWAGHPRFIGRAWTAGTPAMTRFEWR